MSSLSLLKEKLKWGDYEGADIVQALNAIDKLIELQDTNKQLLAALEQQPDVTQLVEALEMARDRIESERPSGEWDPLLRDIDDVLAAHRKQGGRP